MGVGSSTKHSVSGARDMPVIIVEGPDGSGKTTLAQYLSYELYLDYHHEGPTPIDVSPIDYYSQLLRAATNTVFDRLALGERVYGPILRGSDRLGHSGWITFQTLVCEMQALQIMCLPSLNVCFEAWASGREELFTNREQFVRTYDAFRHNTRNHYVYDWTKPFALFNLMEFIHDNQG